MKTKSFVLATFLAATVSCRVTPDQGVVRDVMLEVRSGEASKAAERFHVPQSQPSTGTQHERQFIAEGIAILRDEFGTFDSARPLNDEPFAVNVGVLAADAEYWSKHPELTRFMYAVKFSKLGDGYVMVEICHIRGRPEVRQFAYGVRADDPRRTEVAKRAARRIFELVDAYRAAERLRRRT